MGNVFTKGERIRGNSATAAAQAATDLPIYQQFLQGGNVASATTIAPGIESYFDVTGTTPINFISTAGVLAGKEIHLRFTSSLTLGHNVGGAPGGSAPMTLRSGADTAVGSGGIVGFRYDPSAGAWIQIFGVGDAVDSVSPGTGISITGTSTNVVINNTGVLSLASGPGISITGTSANPVVNNTGVLLIPGGTGGITITGPSQTPTINFPVLTVDQAAFSDGAQLIGSNGFRFNTTKGLYLGNRSQDAMVTASILLNTVTLGAGNHNLLSGGGDIHGIVTANWQSGSRITLEVIGPATIRHSSGLPGSGALDILLANGHDITVPGGGAAYTLDLVLDNTFLGRWIQVSGPPQQLFGSIQLGGDSPLSGSTRVWLPLGRPPLTTADPIEYPIDSFISAGASQFTFSAMVFAYSSTGGATPISLTCKGVVIPGTTFSINAGGVGLGPTTIAIPVDPGTPGPMRIGLSAVPNGTATDIGMAATLAFS